MTDYFVSGTGNDKSNGLTEATAFRNLGRGIYSLKTGDTLYVMDGTYEKGFMLFNKNGSPDSWTIIKAYPGHTPKIKTKADGINIFSCSYVRLEGIVLEGNRENITLEYALKQKLVLNDPLTNANGIAVKAWKDSKGVGGTNSHHIVISGNTVRNFPGGGIHCVDCDYITFEKNIVSGNAWYSPYGTQGISVLRGFNFDNNTTDYRVILQDNIAYDNQSLVPWESTGKVSEGHGIMADTTRVCKDGSPYTGKILFEHNIAYNNGGSGIFAFDATNVTIRHNTCYNNSSYHKSHGEIDATYSENVEVYGNILYARTGRNANLLGGKTLKNAVYHNNLVFNSEIFTDSMNPKVAGLINILGKDPLFSDIENKDFTLKPGSPAVIKEIKQETKLVEKIILVEEIVDVEVERPIGFQGN